MTNLIRENCKYYSDGGFYYPAWCLKKEKFVSKLNTEGYINCVKCNSYKKLKEEIVEAPIPTIRPKLNISDLILIRNALEILKPELIKELQDRADLIIAELARAEKEVKNGN